MRIEVFKLAQNRLNTCDKHLIMVAAYGSLITLPKHFGNDVYTVWIEIVPLHAFDSGCMNREDENVRKYQSACA